MFQTKNVTSIDSNNSLIMGLDEKQHIISIGIDNLNVVATNDAILISSKNKSEELKKIVEKLRSKNLSQAKQQLKILDHGIGLINFKTRKLQLKCYALNLAKS